MVFDKLVFMLAHEAGNPHFYSLYKRLMKNQWRPYEELREEQEIALRNMVDYCFHNVPYYHKLFTGLHLRPEDIKTLEDLEKLPVLTKGIINENRAEFKPRGPGQIKYLEMSTGGTTGTPFIFRVSSNDRFYSGAILYRGWSYAGYSPGDRIFFLAGASLNCNARTIWREKAQDLARNIVKLSSFNMSDKEMRNYADLMNKYKPKFLRGYASSIYVFSRWAVENDVRINRPLSVITTAEKLYPQMRKAIGEAFNCDVFDTYGLNDGSITAFECSEHSGMHIDTERGIMEVVDDDGRSLANGEGKILATSLYNYAMPFIRYDTGDIGRISDEVCGCGRGYRLLKEISGRNGDFILTPNGTRVHGLFFAYVLDDCLWIKEYQVIQEKIDKITIKIVPNKDFDERRLQEIAETIRKKSKEWDVEFKIVDRIDRTKAGKYKYIINNLK